jgi:integrase
MSQHNSHQTEINTAATHAAFAQPTCTFAQVLEIIEGIDGLTPGVRQNLRGAVIRCAKLMSSAGLRAVVDIPSIAKRLEKLSPARLGFKNKNSLAAFKSHLRRALRLAGYTITPARHTTPLSPDWAALRTRLDDLHLRRQLSRFMHVASEQGWPPSEINDTHVLRFRQLLTSTCLKSKVDKTVRGTFKAWNAAVDTIEGWPSLRLEAGHSSDWSYVRPWNEFPATFRKDVESFVNRGDDEDWLYSDTRRDQLRPRTRLNYSGALRRAASILVVLGCDPSSIKTLHDVAYPQQAERILTFLRRRTGRKCGGHVGYMSLVLYMVAKRHLRLEEPDLAMLERFVRNTAERQRGMADQTWERLVQFDDRVVLRRLQNLPEELARSVKGQPVTLTSAKTVRLALALRLIWDTGLRSGNVVALDLDRHVIGEPKERAGTINLFIPGEEVKNGTEFRDRLTLAATRLWNLYVDDYRQVHMSKASTWLFPRSDGSHWNQQQAYGDLKDLGDKLLGVDVTPHLIRALIGKVILDAYPGGHAIAQQVLGHRQLATTVNYYAPTKPSDARALYHEILESRSRRKDFEVL